MIARADPERVRQIIRILLDNALTHTPEGTKVTVTAYSVNRRAELTVSDEGPGIPQRVQGRIFERFYTADTGGRLGARPGDRPRARAADGGPDLDHLEPDASPPSRSTCRRPRPQRRRPRRRSPPRRGA